MEAVIALTVIAVVFIGLVRGWGSPDVIALSGAVALLASGVLGTEELLGVFGNPGAITVGAVFVLSGALRGTGLIELFAGAVRRHTGRSPLAAVLALMLATLIVSAVINNTLVVVVFTPVVIAVARGFSQAPSRWLIPLSYASILGGTCTLIGTSTNLLVDGVARAYGVAPFGVFELTAPGLVMGATGILYLALFGRQLLPERLSTADILETSGQKQFLTELVITTSSELAGKTLSKLGTTIEVVEILRGGQLLPSEPALQLEPGDRIVLRAPAAEAVHLREAAHPDGDEAGDATVRGKLLPAGFEIVREQQTAIREGVVGPGSHFEGRRVGSLNLRRLYDVRILAVHRHGDEPRRNFEKLQLEIGDTLLLEGPPERLKQLFDTRELISLSEPVLRRLRKEKAPIAVAAVLAMILLASTGIVPVAAAAFIAAVAVIAGGCLSASEAYEAIDWRILFLIFGMLAIGRGLEVSGADSLIVAATASAVSGLSPWMALSAVYLTASVLTELITNNAVAIVLTPISIALAHQLGLDPRPFVAAVMFAGSASFATPFGYQTNTFVFGAGNYRFTDFLKVGAPLNVLMWLMASWVIPVFWPLT